MFKLRFPADVRERLLLFIFALFSSGALPVLVKDSYEPGWLRLSSFHRFRTRVSRDGV